MSEILNRAVTKGWGPGAGDFPQGTMSMTLVNFRRKQKENETKRAP